jgi:hypothetical protein
LVAIVAHDVGKAVALTVKVAVILTVAIVVAVEVEDGRLILHEHAVHGRIRHRKICGADADQRRGGEEELRRAPRPRSRPHGTVDAVLFSALDVIISRAADSAAL